MGALDDAIREHLDLKRRLGADEEELKRKEDEAFGRARAWQEDAVPPQMAPEAVSSSSTVERAAVPEAPLPDDGAPLTDIEAAEQEVSEASPPLPPLADEIEPDEVLPEDSLEVEPVGLARRSADQGADDLARDSRSTNGDGAAAAHRQGSDLGEQPGEPPPPLEDVEPDEDMLEQTPDFLEKAPEQDQLWFDKRAPKDFDFDD
jgi:hypothetical protein